MVNLTTGQILNAVSRKLTLAPSVDLDEIARLTEGFSGADLQALVYNAHLEVIHEATDHIELSSESTGEKTPIQYIVIGGPEDSQNRSRTKAEEDDMQKRVSILRI